MKIVTTLVELIPTLGFPIVCVIAMGIFIVYIYKQTTKANAENMEKSQAQCKQREEILYNEIKENREINAEAIKTIAKYAERLEVIQSDIKEIKTDITVIMAKDRT